MKLCAIYCQTSGSTVIMDGGEPVTGYSGAPGGVNNPTMEHIRNVGPIPRGRYLIGQPHAHKRFGPVVMTLFPSGHGAKGRSGFLIHGDNTNLNRTASQGCVILDRQARERIARLASDESEGTPYILVVR